MGNVKGLKVSFRQGLLYQKEKEDILIEERDALHYIIQFLLKFYFQIFSLMQLQLCILTLL